MTIFGRHYFISNKVVNLPLSTNIHANTLGPMNKVISIELNGYNLDSRTVGMDAIYLRLQQLKTYFPTLLLKSIGFKAGKKIEAKSTEENSKKEMIESQKLGQVSTIHRLSNGSGADYKQCRQQRLMVTDYGGQHQTQQRRSLTANSRSCV